MPLDFNELIHPAQWKEYEVFIQTSDTAMERDIQKSLAYRRQLRAELLKSQSIREKITRIAREDIELAEQQLFTSNVVAIDGTLSRYPMVTGTRCRIGVVSTSYKNDRIERVLYVSERELAEPSSSAMDHFSKLLKSQAVSDLLMRALMFFKERQLALERDEEWKFVHGELLPFELRTGVGRLRALEVILGLGRQIIENKKVIGVIEETTHLELLNAGEILNPYEYICAKTLKEELGAFLDTARFASSDEAKFRDFAEQYGAEVVVGIYRVGPKPYVFQCHKDSVNEAIALVMADSQFQALRGFPLLLDYADSICARLLSQHDFSQQIMTKIVSQEVDALGFELYPRTTRRR